MRENDFDLIDEIKFIMRANAIDIQIKSSY